MKNVFAALLAGSLATAAAMPALAADGDLHQSEAQIGASVYAQLSKKGEIVTRDAAPAQYALLDPIASRIATIADSQYDFPFRFIIVREKQPNAFAVPGGNVYVTDSLLRFVQNREELAGVLCHETSHDIHHDVVDTNAKDQTVGTLIGVLGALTGVTNSGIGQIGANLAYTLQTQTYSRTVESAADAKGALTCAQSGFNPWGMVWLFKNFEKADTGGSMEALSDHPRDDHRISDLQRRFAANPGLFGRFSSNIASATPLSSIPIAMPGLSNATRRVVPVVRRAPTPYCCTPH